MYMELNGELTPTSINGRHVDRQWQTSGKTLDELMKNIRLSFIDQDGGEIYTLEYEQIDDKDLDLLIEEVSLMGSIKLVSLMHGGEDGI